MSREYWGIAALTLASILLVTVFGRTAKPRESLFLFVVGQAVSWPGTIILTFMGSFEVPVRLFPKATDSNFALAFIFLPAVYVAYYWHFPGNKSRIIQIAYTLAVTGGSALAHVAVQKYTDLLVYIDFTGYRLWLINIISYYAGRIYCDWFFSQVAKARGRNPR